MCSSTKNDKLTDSLDEIESLLLSDRFTSEADYISGLRRLYRSVMISDKEEFERIVTTDKFLWLGMGTIADRCLSSKEAGQRFTKAYLNFANECERLGLGSQYSRDLASAFGKWTH